MKRSSIFALLCICISTANSIAANADSAVLPISAVTPGAINPSVTQANIATTICTLGYTLKIRPPVSYTTKLKIKQLASLPYSAYGSKDTALFEEDHLISLELGGSPTDTKNLWPEPWDGPFGARVKDKLENKLHAMVCAHQIALAKAQGVIASNWYSAYQVYVLGMSTQPTPTPTPTPTPSPTLPSASLNHPANATGKCKDGIFSYAATHRGMCSGHGGVLEFYS